MNDRFTYKAVLHQDKYEEYELEKFSHQRVFDVMSINLGIEYSTVEIIAEYPNGDWAVREIDDEDIDLIQATGLKDKNEELIYEGDILKETYFFENKQCKDITVVKWLDDSASFVMEHVGCENDFTYFNDYDVNLENFEIIGNQYENQELLNH